MRQSPLKIDDEFLALFGFSPAVLEIAKSVVAQIEEKQRDWDWVSEEYSTHTVGLPDAVGEQGIYRSTSVRHEELIYLVHMLREAGYQADLYADVADEFSYTTTPSPENTRLQLTATWWNPKRD
ncbi:hypothetical protein D3C71_77470 [compost metagenome]